MLNRLDKVELLLHVDLGDLLQQPNEELVVVGLARGLLGAELEPEVPVQHQLQVPEVSLDGLGVGGGQLGGVGGRERKQVGHDEDADHQLIRSHVPADLKNEKKHVRAWFFLKMKMGLLIRLTQGTNRTRSSSWE